MKKCICRILGLLLAMLLAACGQKAEVSSGQLDRVNGFMFVFDNRSTTETLKEDMDASRIPIRVTWRLEKRGETTDEQEIRNIYREMSEMIVVGQTSLNVEDHRYFVEYALQDGSVAHFDFVNLSILRMGDQRYVLESDGGLWKLLRSYQAK